MINVVEHSFILFLKNSPASFTIVVDVDQQCAKAFDVKAMPSTYLIDRKGIIRHIHLGFRSHELKELNSALENLLAEPI